MTSKAAGIGAGELMPVGQGSLTVRTTHALLEAILDRRFASDRLPNELVLAEQMRVSRTTIRTALQSLDRLGVISRVPGRGTQLRPHIGRESMLLHRLIGIRGMLEGLHSDVSVEQTFTVREQISELGALALGVPVTTPVLLNDKTYLVHGQSAVHLVQEVPMANVLPHDADGLVSGATEPPRSIFEFSIRWPGGEIDHTVLEMVPQVAGGEGAEGSIASLPEGTPYVEMRETHYSDRNVPIAYGREMVDDKFARLRLVRTD